MGTQSYVISFPSIDASDMNLDVVESFVCRLHAAIALNVQIVGIGAENKEMTHCFH